MIQTTKDADKAKTSQRQRVDDQNDRFVSRNCHHAPPPVALFWALFFHFFNGFPDLLRDAHPGTAKERVGFRGVYQKVILYLTSVTKSIQPSSWLMIRS